MSHSTSTDTRLMSHRYIDAFYENVDGNFRGVQKSARSDPNDKPLTKRGGFYADEDDYDEFQSKRPRNTKEVRQSGAWRVASR